MPAVLLVAFVLTALYWLLWCENRYHDNLPVYKAGGSLQSGGASTKREGLQSGSVYKAGGSTKREASPVS